ncbi:hypothetical protein DFH07DRAFT_774241 [Mycena maculata]|uniref:DUF6589 domain-containing protein n=1 Tax=Mycena maculata TaxID=230809 RepID=A0AAD7IYK7_9AGAR|nr:hypothetical protein DFH07DRAFT_774241 [Mycena maculata]
MSPSTSSTVEEDWSLFEDHYEDLDHSELESDRSEIGPDPEPDTDDPSGAPQTPSMGLRAQAIIRVLQFMDGNGVTLANLLDGISWGDQDCTLNAKIRNERTRLLNSPELPGILQRWWKPPRPSRSKKRRPNGARAVMQEFALECTQQMLEVELESLEKLFKSPAGEDIKEEHLTGISFHKMVTQVKDMAPNLWKVLFRLARTEPQQKRNPHKNPVNTILIMISMFSYSQTHHRGLLQKLFSIYFKFQGLSAKGFDTLHAIGLTMSNKWTGNAVGRISAESMTAMKRLMDLFPWIMSYDNALVPFQVFAQRIDHQSGYLFDSPDFDFSTYNGCDHDLLQRPPPIQQLPFGKEHIFLQYLLGTVNIPEASYEDNAQLIEEWLKQLGRNSPEWQKKIALELGMAWVGDHLTVDRLHNLFRFRAEDDNSFERLDWLVIPPGWLHIQMAFANSIHKQHLGTRKGRGLSAAFDILGRKGLQSAHTQGPFFHDLSEALHFIAEAQICELEHPKTSTD